MEPQQEPNKFLIPLAIIVAGGLVASAIYFGGGTGTIVSTSNNNANTPVNVAPVTEKDHIRGSMNADLVIVEYSDTECPYCKSFHNTLKEVVRAYDGKVAWVYRQFPIAQLHSKAPHEAEATECAALLGGNQGFWNYIDKVFETTKSNDSLDPAELPKIASTVGLDVAAFNDCLSSGRFTDFITASVAEAVKAGARGTPHSIIITKDGKKIPVSGAESLASLKVRIDELLK